MNTQSPIGRSHKQSPRSVPSVAPAYSPVAGVTVPFSRIARVSGEGFDADQIGWSCDECGRDEYACECEVEETFVSRGPTMTHQEALDRIARVFLGVGIASEVSSVGGPQ